MTSLDEPQTHVTIERAADHAHEQRRRADAFDGRGVWIRRCTADEIDAQLDALAGRLAQGAALPLLGLTLAVKDNIDVAGLPTTAACPAFAYTPQRSAFVVRRLTDAGAIVLGKTNLDQFATGLVGTRSPYGACENFYDKRYVSGGSSSGSAVAVAAGLTDFALGTDTAGSGRVPAAFNNLYGVKPSCGLVSNSGTVPACRSLDCVAVFAADLPLARRVLAMAEGFDAADPFSRDRRALATAYDRPLAADFRVGVPADDLLDFFGDAEYERLFAAARARFAAIGARERTIDAVPFFDAARLLYEGPWVAERLAGIREFFEHHGDDILPVTRQIIGSADRFSAADAFSGVYDLAALRRRASQQWDDMDVLLLPTAGTIHTIAAVNADPVALNRDLGYYTNFVNLLDLCALAVPAGFTGGGLPFGVTLIAPAGNEPALFAAAERFAEVKS